MLAPSGMASAGQGLHSKRSRMRSGIKPSTRREHVRVAVTALLGAKKTQRLDQMEVQFRARHGDTQNPTLFFDLFRAACPHIRWYTTIRDIENVDDVPFLSLGRMNRGQYEIVFVEQGCTGFGTAGLRRWSVNSVRKRSRVGNPAEICSSFSRSPTRTVA